MENKKIINYEKKWKKANLSNNFIFYKVMRHHQEECKKLLEMLLNIKIRKMEMHNEEIIDLDHDKKGIRLDIFVKEQKRMHDIELQVINKKEIPKRARYYAGLIYSFENICYVDDAKHNMQWRQQYMTYLRQRNYDREEGRAEKAIEDAVIAVKEFKVTPQVAAKKMKAPLAKVLKALEVK